MKTMNFLQSVADYFCRRDPGRPAPENIVFVLPNKRSALFLKKYVRDSFATPTLMPRFMTMATFVSIWCKYPAADRMELLFVLFDAYKTVLQRLGRRNESRQFDEFIFWGDMMLNDFDDIDRSMANAAEVFKNIKNLKDIQADFLDDEQKEVIRRVWGESRLTAHIERFWLHDVTADAAQPLRDRFVSLWEILGDVYIEYHKLLGERNRNSAGMQYRSAADAVRFAEKRDFAGNTSYAFVGFNDLTISETILFERLNKQGIAYFFWDTSAIELFAKGTTMPVSLQRLQRLAKAFPNPDGFELPTSTVKPDVRTIAIPSNTAQAKYVRNILDEWIKEGYIDTENAINTAIIVPDEGLLLPLLASIPQEIKALNISMGLPFRTTTFATLLHSIISMQLRSRTIRGVLHFFYEDVIAVMSHPHIQAVAPECARAVTDAIRENRLYNIAADKLCSDYPELAPIFTPVGAKGDACQVSEYLIALLNMLGAAFTKKVETDNLLVKPFELSAIEYFREEVETLTEFVKAYNIQMSERTFFHLFERALNSRAMTLSGTPLRGLQVLGVLETRGLDFDNVIVLSMNESVFPRNRYSKTMVPATLRSGYGLPDFDSAEWSYSYCYYRLLSRAKRVTLVYDSRITGVGQGVTSRYLIQTLHLLPGVVQQQDVLSLPISPGFVNTFSIQKTDSVLAALDEFRTGGSRRFSATALKTYLTCKFKFYLQYVRNMRSSDEIVENITAAEYGNVIHRTIQKLYDDHRADHPNVLINGDILQGWIDSDLKPLIMSILNEEHYHLDGDLCYDEYNTECRVATEAIEVVVKSNLISEKEAYCKNGDSFTYLESEMKVVGPWQVTPDLSINFFMAIDRVDQIRAKLLRFIDFKTGTQELSAKLNDLFEGRYGTDGMFQLLLYCAAYRAMVDPETDIVPMIHAMRKIASSEPLQQLTMGEPITAYTQVAEQFEEKLKLLFEDIFNKDIPFDQREKDTQPCEYCPFLKLCGRVIENY